MPDPSFDDVDVSALADRIIPLLGIVWSNATAEEMTPLAEAILGREMNDPVDQAIVLTAWLARTCFNLAVEDKTTVVEAMRKMAALRSLGEPI